MHAHMEFKEAGRVYEKVVEEKGVWETMSLKSDLKETFFFLFFFSFCFCIFFVALVVLELAPCSVDQAGLDLPVSAS